jgi:pimeloyl-ACP methyl ester carboxylesterase
MQPDHLYSAIRLSTSHFVPIRGLNYHVRTWGQRRPYNPQDPSTIPLVMVHGWMDVSASFQFVVDAFKADHYVVAPDWRGYGLTTGAPTDNYWMPDYLADLDFLIDALLTHPTLNGALDQSASHRLEGSGDNSGNTRVPPLQIDLLGHSMGGNIAMLYAGIRPERIRRLINLEGFGLPRTTPDQAPKRYAQWMDQLKKFHRNELDLTPYPSAAGVAARLMKTNRRLSPDKALWLAQHWAQEVQIPGGVQWQILGDPAHKIINANLYQADEAIALYQQISAPLLAVEAAENEMGKWYSGKFTLADYHERLGFVANCQIQTVADAGHMMHHDQPQVLAHMIETFLVNS